MIRLTADWLLTMDGPPVARGGVLLDGPTLVAVGPADRLPSPPGVREERVAGVLMPGLVNTHTHLELTGLPVGVPPADFPGWIRALRAAKEARPPAWFGEAAAGGVRAGFAGGVTTFVDTGDSGAALDALVAAGASGVVYQEVFGPDPTQLQASLDGLSSRLAGLRGRATDRVRVGVSPHAPYTVSGPLYRAVAALAARESVPIAVHLAESAAESELVIRGTGPFAEAWRARGIPPLDPAVEGLPPASRRSPVAWLDAHGVLGPDTLCIHCVRVDERDIALLRSRGASVAHCPISNAEHGHGSAPLSRLLGAGIPVGVGTDSELSVGTVDLFREARAARELADLDAGAALGLVTADAARAVGLGARVGRLEPGLDADLVALAVDPGPDGDPEATALQAGPGDVLLTVAAGRVVYRRGHPA
ncbi:MAG: amidohydrolase family protein [Gemmatimonadales bacterium]